MAIRNVYKTSFLPRAVKVMNETRICTTDYDTGAVLKKLSYCAINRSTHILCILFRLGYLCCIFLSYLLCVYCHMYVLMEPLMVKLKVNFHISGQ